MWLAGKKTIAEYCQLSIELLTLLHKKHSLPIYIHKKGAMWRTTTEALDEWLNNHTNQKLIKSQLQSHHTSHKTVSKTIQK